MQAMRASPYAGRDEKSSSHSLCGASQVRGGLTRFAIPTFNQQLFINLSSSAESNGVDIEADIDCD